jgi:hypothetical protein
VGLPAQDGCLQVCSSNEHASAANRKTITPLDVFNALEDLEFPDFRPRLEAELASQFLQLIRITAMADLLFRIQRSTDGQAKRISEQGRRE